MSTASGAQLTNNVHNTSYRASYCERVYDSRRSHFASHLGHRGGTGFMATHALYQRPGNLQFGLELSGGFTSQSKPHCQPSVMSGFSGSLPNIINKPVHSRFPQLWSHPRTALPVEEKTEYQTVYVPHRLTPTVFRNIVTGHKGESGFTKGSDLQLHTFQEKNICNLEPRWNPSSVMKNDFSAPWHPQGTEAIPGLTSHSCRETGFTRGTIAPLACPSSLLPSPQTKRTAPSEKTFGPKEPTGSLLNAPNHHIFPKTAFDDSHFITQYKSAFCHQADFAPTGPGVIKAQIDSGYSRRDEDRYISKG